MKNKTINWDLAELCAWICEYAYEDTDAMKKFLTDKKIKHTNLKFFEVGNSQAYGITMHDYIVIAFRGTEPTQFSDIIADIKAWPADAETKGHVHSGFKGELDKLYPNIRKWLGKKVTTKKLVITGHSLGAAMATICTSRFHALGANQVLYTYGCPRTGNKEWGEQFKDIEAYRFVNNNDIVPQVPPFGYYHHIGELYYMSYTNKISNNMSYFQRLKDKLRGRCRAWSKFQFFDNLYDHLGAHYIKKIISRK